MSDAAAYWDAQADGFDEAADHGLRDAGVREAWESLLIPLLPPAPARVADLGCGTGSLSVLLAGQGHEVCGIDLAPRMVERARAKAADAGIDVRFLVGDAARPRGLMTASMSCSRAMCSGRFPTRRERSSAGSGSSVPRDGWSWWRADGGPVPGWPPDRCWTCFALWGESRR